MDEMSFLPRLSPEELIGEAELRWQPIATACLFSGGNDSGVLAHRCRSAYDHLLFIDTGTAVPGVEEHVRRFAEWLEKPLIIRRSVDAYRKLVLGDDLWWERFESVRQDHPGLTVARMIARNRDDVEHGRVSAFECGEPPGGFPGHGRHNKAYSRLKERRIEEHLRCLKEGHPRTANVLFLSGVRRDESRRRATRQPLTERFSAKYCNPLIEWTNGEMRAYREEHQLPESDVVALLHRSGECNCGAFAAAGEERAMLRSLWPGWWEDTIRALEDEAEAKGIRWCRWGGYDLDGNQAARSAGEAGPLCSSCELRLFTS